MAKKLFSIDVGQIKQTALQAKRGIDVASRLYQQKLEVALLQYAEHLLGIAAQRAPIDTGALRASHQVEGPIKRGQETKVTFGFNLKYARIQDLGGTIRPVRAKALFIPLRKGARPGDKSLAWGVDFVLAKEVTLKGNRYFTGTIEEAKANAGQVIARRVKELMLGKR